MGIFQGQNQIKKEIVNLIYMCGGNLSVVNCNVLIVTCELKELIHENSNLFKFLLYLPPLKSYFKNKDSIFNSAPNILDF